MNFAKQLSNMIAKSIQQAYEQTEETIKKSYKNIDDKLDAIKLFSLNIIKEVDKLASQAEKNEIENILMNNKNNDYQELPEYIILRDGNEKDCPIVVESKYAEEILDFIIPLIGKGINFDPAANYPSIDKQKQWFEENLRKYGYFGVDDGFYSPMYTLSYRENKDFKERGGEK